MPSEVILRYHRAGDRSTGKVILRLEGNETELDAFTECGFIPMMSSFAKALSEYREALAVIERDDRPGLLPMVLSAYDAHLLRTDPVTAIRGMMYVQVPVDPRPKGIMTGYDVLAEAFGDETYLRVRGKHLECVGCGTWQLFDEPVGAQTSWDCPKCRIHLAGITVRDERWVSIKTETLVGLASRLYLPRGWNKHRWVEHDAFEKKYLEYMKEKEGLP